MSCLSFSFKKHKTMCGKFLKRPHSCVINCRYRLAVGNPDYVYFPNIRIYVPRKCTVYTLFIKNDRKHEKLKEILIKKVLSVAELLAN